MENHLAMPIRPFHPKDQSAVRSLVLTGLGDHFGEIDETMNPDLDDISAAYTANGHLVFVWEEAGRIVATGTMLREAPGIGRIVRISVASDQRGKGIGKAMVAHLLQAARERGDRQVLLETNHDWTDAIGLYRACGFVDQRLEDGDLHMAIDLASVRPASPAVS